MNSCWPTWRATTSLAGISSLASVADSNSDPHHSCKLDPDPHQSEKHDQDPYQSEKQDPDPHQIE
jgi:hypothetical protein